MVTRVRRGDVGILVIDVQPFFLEWAFPDQADAEPLLTRLENLFLLAEWMDLPTVITYEIPTKDNGRLPERLEALAPTRARHFEKDWHGAMAEKPISEAIVGLGVRQIAVVGAETDVCVLQTVLGLLDAGYQVFVLEDCVSTTEPHPGPALKRMYQAGAVPSTLKTFSYELTARVTDCPWYPDGYAMAEHDDARPFLEGFTLPEELPPWTPRY